MPVMRRYLVREESGRLVDLPSRAFDHADDGVAPIPAFAGRCVDLVSAIVVAEQGAQPHVAEVAFTKLYFDDSGFIDARKRERMIRLMLESCADRRCRSPETPGCGDLNRRAFAARSELAREFGWQPGPAEVNEVLHRLDLRGAGATAATVH
ncbi:hypothetical protein [Azospirillum halopraeferens]|uniref:hypothetical protein n=1 Tax=Azospirillum halopraeferens TaxID=34010 RepID=UPI000491D830|nr:hypothetical protein [Azospirillum halopraeferens]